MILESNNRNQFRDRKSMKKLLIAAIIVTLTLSALAGWRFSLGLPVDGYALLCFHVAICLTGIGIGMFGQGYDATPISVVYIEDEVEITTAHLGRSHIEIMEGF